VVWGGRIDSHTNNILLASRKNAPCWIVDRCWLCSFATSLKYNGGISLLELHVPNCVKGIRSDTATKTTITFVGRSGITTSIFVRHPSDTLPSSQDDPSGRRENAIAR
jgi:hypothetical protein